ncbi:cyclic GMP-AMP synthase-like isoform X2 [Harmonia axyridis]|nr:cyclic GMP-AMP synthase-like isoform X2 [Harmonia axyridis]
MKSKDILFKNLFNKILFGGSYYDGLKIHLPDEYDIDIVLKLPKKANAQLTVNEKPGFVKVYVELDSLSKESDYNKEYKSMEKFVDGNYLMTNKFREWFEGVCSKVISSIGNYKFSKSGPAMTLKTDIEGKKVCVDLVPCFIFTDQYWPAKPYRKNASTSKGEFLVVPKDPKVIVSPYIFWRLSFQEQEKDVITGKNGLKDTIRLLKLLRNRQFNESSFASYFIKTVMMLFSEKVDDTFWRNPRSYIFMMGLKYFGELLKQKTIPYYWNKEYNLLTGMKEATLIQMSNRIDRIIKNLENQNDSPTRLRLTLLEFFGLPNLYEESPDKIGKDNIEEDGNSLLKEDSTGTAEENSNEDSSIRKERYSVLSSSHGNESAAMTSKLNDTQKTERIRWTSVTKNEAFAIYVSKKLEEMTETQGIYAEKLISDILIKGSLDLLTVDTNICDKVPMSSLLPETEMHKNPGVTIDTLRQNGRFFRFTPTSF